MICIAVSDDVRRQHETMLRNALEHAHLTMQQASAEAEINQAQFTRQIQGLEGSLKRLWMLPPVFWQWYALELLAFYGLPTLVQRAARAAFGWFALKRMRRGSLSVLHPINHERRI